MPLDRTRYRRDWDDFAHSLKCAAKWTCQLCGKPCRQKGESVQTFANRIFTPQSAAWLDAMTYPQKFCLTVAHLDQNPRNDAPDNVLALCAPCHLNYDRPHLVSNAYAKLERNGQGVLWFISSQQEKYSFETNKDIPMSLINKNPEPKFPVPFGWDAIEAGLDTSFVCEPEIEQYSLFEEDTSFFAAEDVDEDIVQAQSNSHPWEVR
jgi:hypothetical protein